MERVISVNTVFSLLALWFASARGWRLFGYYFILEMATFVLQMAKCSWVLIWVGVYSNEYVIMKINKFILALVAVL